MVAVVLQSLFRLSGKSYTSIYQYILVYDFGKIIYWYQMTCTITSRHIIGHGNGPIANVYTSIYFFIHGVGIPDDVPFKFRNERNAVQD